MLIKVQAQELNRVGNPLKKTSTTSKFDKFDLSNVSAVFKGSVYLSSSYSFKKIFFGARLLVFARSFSKEKGNEFPVGITMKRAFSICAISGEIYFNGRKLPKVGLTLLSKELSEEIKLFITTIYNLDNKDLSLALGITYDTKVISLGGALGY